ncbi:979_t:CDS:10 [Cetraspora pellucida]|uniref:979_t:CDS:1 n=1 Tax=Cetraspora pellucida TaxID=1433469 RepID=A0A9N9EGF6_9GLOM|nr:979_t:CDS:10 [Cetraspora pellucida]
MFKVDGAEYAFSTWFAEIESKKYKAGMTEERAQEILNAIDNGEFLIKVKFIKNDSVYGDESQTKIAFKIIDKYEPICESKKAGGKYIRDGPNVILIKKMKLGFWVGIDEKFLVRKVSEQSEVERLDSNAVVYGLYQIRKPDVNRLMPIKDGTLNCIAKQVIEHFDQAKRGHELTKIRWQKINDWEKKMRIPVESIDQGDTWEAISNALRGPQAIWLIKVGNTSQTISQFVLEDGRTFRTWKKHTEIIEACKQLQYREGIINKEKKSILSESLKVVDLAEQNAPDYHVNDVICIDMKECYPASMRGQGECTPWFNRFGHPIHYLVRVAVNGELPEDDITRFVQIGILESVTNKEAIISLTKQTKVWLPRSQDISCAIIGKFTQGGKIDEKCLTHRLVTDEGKLDFLIKDCTNAGTFVGREKCPLRFILTYYEGHQPQYTHLQASMLAYAYINLLEMLQRFDPNEVVRIATDSIYIRKETLYKIENIPAFFEQVEIKSDPNLCSHYPFCAMCTDPEELFISKSEYAKWIKEFLKTKRPLVKYNCKKHKPFVCRFCFGEWFYKPDFYALSHQPEEQEIQEIQSSQWRDKDEKIYRPVTNIVYWPKNRHWESIKNIPKSTAPSIHDPITRCRKSYLNGGGGSEKTTCAIRIFKNINMVVFTHTNALAKDFQEKLGEWTPECMGEKKFPRVVIWDEVICCGDDAQPLPFFGEMPHNWLKEHADYYEEVLTDYHAKCPNYMNSKKLCTLSDHILSAHRLSRRIASQKCLELHHIKYSDLPIPLIYRPRDGRKQNCLVPIPSSSEKQELVKNDIVYLSLNMLPEKFIKDILSEEKILDWNLGYAMTVHTSCVEYLNQLVRIEGSPLPPEIEEAKNKKAIERSLRSFISGKLVGYMDQDKKKDYMVKQVNDSVMDFYMKVKASTSDSKKQVREIFINGLSPENYLEAEKFESEILLNELVGRLWVLESECKAKYIKLKAEVINIIKNAFKNGAEDLKKLKTEQPEFYDFYFKI